MMGAEPWHTIMTITEYISSEIARFELDLFFFSSFNQFPYDPALSYCISQVHQSSFNGYPNIIVAFIALPIASPITSSIASVQTTRRLFRVQLIPQ